MAEIVIYRAALCDFGCTYDSSDVLLTSVNSKSLFDSKAGNVIHHAPELATVREDSRAICDVSKADLWAVGLLGYEAITGLDPVGLVPNKVGVIYTSLWHFGGNVYRYDSGHSIRATFLNCRLCTRRIYRNCCVACCLVNHVTDPLPRKRAHSAASCCMGRLSLR